MPCGNPPMLALARQAAREVPWRSTRPSRIAPRSRGPPRPRRGGQAPARDRAWPAAAACECRSRSDGVVDEDSRHHRAALAMASGSAQRVGRAGRPAAARRRRDGRGRSRREGCRAGRPESVRVSSRLARVAASISSVAAGRSRRGGRRCGTRPTWVMTMYSRSPPRAAISARGETAEAVEGRDVEMRP